MRPRLRSKILVVVYGLTICCVPFLVMVPLGTASIVVAVLLFVAFLLSDSRTRAATITTAVGTSLGASFGFAFLSPAILSSVYLYDHGFGESVRCDAIGSFTGALVGFVLASIINFRRPKRDNTKTESS